MHILVIVLLIIAGLVLLLLVAALFIKKEYTISRDVVIEQPVQPVFDYIRLFKNQDHYNKWIMMDPGAHKEMEGIDGTVGFIYKWESKNKRVGKGEQEIKQIFPGKKIDYEVRFKEPFEGKALGALSTESVTAGRTKVNWTFRSGMKYPMNVMLLFINIPEMLGKDIETSLSNLKKQLEPFSQSQN